MIYKDNKQLKIEFKKVLLDEGLRMADVARRLDIVPQQLNNKFNNTRIGFADLAQWLDVVGYDLEITFKKKG